MSALKIKRRKKQEEKPSIVDQWVEIEVIDGITRTTRYPPDQEITNLILEKEEREGRPVELVYRRMNFVHGVPQEYLWAAYTPEQIQYGGHSIQRLRVDDWMQLSAIEKNGHMKGSKFNMPRPESSGGCECPVCRAAAHRIATKGY